MTTRPRAPDFEAALLPALERAGLSGTTVTVRLDGEVLRVAGDAGGELAIAAQEVERLRLVRFAGSRVPTLYEAKIWRQGSAEPLLLIPPSHGAGDGAAMRGFAAAVASRRGIARVMRGPDLATAIVNLLLTVGSVTALLGGALLLAWYDGGWGWWLLAAAIALVDGFMLRDMLARRWPRRIASLEELDSELPATEERSR